MTVVKTSAGQEIDMAKLILKNEEVRAVGNMNVNARGDVINNSNKTVASRSAQVNKAYRKQIGTVAQDVPIGNKPADDAPKKQPKSKKPSNKPDSIIGLDSVGE